LRIKAKPTKVFLEGKDMCRSTQIFYWLIQFN